MKNAVLTAALILTALGAGAQGMPQFLGNDPLSRQILAKTAQPNAGVTAVVRVDGSDRGIELKSEDSALPAVAAKLAPAASSADLRLKTASGLARASKKSSKRARLTLDVLKKVRVTKNWGDKR